MSSVGRDILEGYSLRALVAYMARNLLNVQNKVGAEMHRHRIFIFKDTYMKKGQLSL